MLMTACELFNVYLFCLFKWGPILLHSNKGIEMRVWLFLFIIISFLFLTIGWLDHKSTNELIFKQMEDTYTQSYFCIFKLKLLTQQLIWKYSSVVKYFSLILLSEVDSCYFTNEFSSCSSMVCAAVNVSFRLSCKFSMYTI